MSKCACLGVDEDRCIRIASMSTEGQLVLPLFSPAVSLDSELTHLNRRLAPPQLALQLSTLSL